MKLPYIEAGQIVAVHGLRGECKVLVWLSSPALLCTFRRCRIDGKEYAVRTARVQKNCVLLGLSGVDTVEQAQALRGKTVEVFREDVPDGMVFAAELIGMEVYANDVKLGRVRQVQEYPANAVYVVQGEKTYRIPAVCSVVLRTDLDTNRMDIVLLEGMADDED